VLMPGRSELSQLSQNRGAGEMDIVRRTSYAGTMPMASISCRPHRAAKLLRRFGIWLWGSGIPDESRDRHPCLSRLCLTSGCIIPDARRILGGLVACLAWCKLGT
jgi:hypothetical protein